MFNKKQMQVSNCYWCLTKKQMLQITIGSDDQQKKQTNTVSFNKVLTPWMKAMYKKYRLTSWGLKRAWCHVLPLEYFSSLIPEFLQETTCVSYGFVPVTIWQ